MPQIAGACDFRTRRVLLFDCRLHSGVRPIPARPTSNALKQLYDGLSGSACIHYAADDHSLTPSQLAADIDDNLFANILNNPSAMDSNRNGPERRSG